MILKNLAAVCNAHKRIFLYSSATSDVQWAGDGKAFYPLHGVPWLDGDTIQTIFSVPEKQRNKFDIQDLALPGYLDCRDVPDCGEIQLRPEELSIGYEDTVLYPVRTRRGLMFYNPIYLRPLNDKLAKIEMYERESPTGQVYFAAKAGTFLEAIILPEDVNEEKLLDKLRDLTDDLETTLHCQTAEEEVEDDPAQIRIDPRTGEVLNA